MNLLLYWFDLDTDQSFWTTWNAPFNNHDCGRELGIYSSDDEMHIYIVGYSFYYAAAQCCEAIILKYDYNSQNWVDGWPILYGDSLYDIFTSHVIIDEDIYMTGTTESYGSGASGCNNPSGHITKDVFVAKYNSNFVCQWWVTWNGGGIDCSNSICTDGTFLYVAGYTADEDDNNKDSLLIKYDLTGDIKWARIWDNGGNEWANAVAADMGTSGDIFVTGCGDYNPQMNLETFVLKYDKDGGLYINIPNILWPITTLSCALDDSGNAIVLDSNNAYIAGYITTIETKKDVSIFNVNKLTGWWMGIRWNNEQQNGDDCANSILIGNGQFYIGGYTETANGPDPLIQKRILWGSSPEWSYIWSNPGEDSIRSIVFGYNTIYAGGYYWNGNDFDALVMKINSQQGTLDGWNDWGLGDTDGITSISIYGEQLNTVGWSYDTRYNSIGSHDGMINRWGTDNELTQQAGWPKFWG